MTRGARHLLALLAAAGCSGPEIALISSHHGPDGVGPAARKVLVAYGSWAGSTAEVADVIGQALADDGLQVDVRPVGAVAALDGYQAVVLGSAVRAGALKPEVLDFVRRHNAELQRLRTAYFVVCLVVTEGTPESAKTAQGYLDPLRQEVTPLEVGVFAGKMDSSKLDSFSRFVVVSVRHVPEGDSRDWNAIRAWATALAPRLTPAAQEAPR